MKYQCRHKVQYYETDQMGVVHHSNYIRWFEEARNDLLEQAGFGYARMEETGIISPVLSVCANYRSMTRFGEEVVMETQLLSYNGVKLRLAYRVMDARTGQERCDGTSEHCFLDRNGRILSLKKSYPEVHKLLQEIADQRT